MREPDSGQAIELFGGRRRCLGDPINGLPDQFRDRCADVHHVRRLVLLAPVWDRCQIRRVGFDHELIERRCCYGGPQLLGVLERDDPACLLYTSPSPRDA